MSYKTRAKLLLSKYLQNTTVHGIPNIVATKPVFAKVMWMIMFLTMIGFMITYLTSLLVDYYKYPIYVKLERISKTQMEFPSVTIANGFPFQFSLNLLNIN